VTFSLFSRYVARSKVDLLNFTANQEVKVPRTCWFIEKVSPVWNQEGEGVRKQLVPTLFIFHRGDAYAGIERFMTKWPYHAPRSIISRLNAFHHARTNPRSFEYMKEVISTRLRSSGSAPVNDLSVLPPLEKFEQIILLWPDGNGMGWSSIERKVIRAKNATARVYVLNGRRRLFELQRRIWRGYKVRRFLEKSFLLESGVLVVFLVTAPILALWDFVIGADNKA